MWISTVQLAKTLSVLLKETLNRHFLRKIKALAILHTTQTEIMQTK